MKKFKKPLITAFKILLSVGLLYLVFTKIPFKDVWEQIKTSKVEFLLLAFFALFISQWISAKRLLLYFHEIDYRLDENENLRLYFIGMFYNFFIPGGIGGDAYKVFYLNKKYTWKAKKLTAALLNDRLSGLLAIVLLIGALSWTIIPKNLWFLVPLVLVVSVIAGFLIQKILFKSFRNVFFQSLGWSLLVQGFQLLCIYFLLVAIGNTQDIFIYFLVFLVSAVLSVLSFSGIGIREWFFMQSANYFTFNAEISVTLALLFSFLTAIISLLGVYFQIRKSSSQNS